VRRTQIQLPDELYQEVRRRSYEQGTSLSEMVRRLLRDSLRPRAGPRRLRTRDFSFVGAARSKQGRLEPVSERHDEALIEPVE
jgi:metal-responsive CopG/Arc/MetJ family transcriptional regulator